MSAHTPDQAPRRWARAVRTWLASLGWRPPAASGKRGRSNDTEVGSPELQQIGAQDGIGMGWGWDGDGDGDGMG